MARRRVLRGRSGSALTTVMLLTAALVPLGAYAVVRSRLDVLIQEHTRRGLEAFYVAESGLAHALADLAWDPRYARLGAGPDGRTGTAGDQLYPFRDAPPEFFPAPPSHYRVEVATIDASAVDIVSYGYGIGLSSRAVATRVRRSPAPYVPAALYTSDPQDVDIGDDLLVRGASLSAGEEVPAVAADDDPDVKLILSRLSATARSHLRGPGPAPNVRRRGFQALGGLVGVFGQLANAQRLPSSVQGSLGMGVFFAPQSLDVGDTDGRGVLVVDGNLQVTGRFVFGGLVLVAGDVRADAGTSLDISGALLQTRAGHTLRLEGAGSIAYDARLLDDADSLSKNVLPRRAIIGPWRELS